MHLPETIIATLDPFRPAFTRPTWAQVTTLVVGTLLARGRRTVAAASRAVGLDRERRFSRYHAVLSHAAWSPLDLGRILLGRVVAAFAPAGGLTLVVDETLERRRGPRIARLGHHRDPIASGRSQHVVAGGLRWIVLAAVVPVPWARRPWALPLLSALAPSAKADARDGRRHRTLAGRARQMIAAVRRWAPGVPPTVVGDTTYSVVELGPACRRRGVRLAAPLRPDAALYDEPVARLGKVGRPRVVGDRLPTPTARREAPETTRHRAEVAWPDSTTRALELATGIALWYQPGRGPSRIRRILTRDPDGRLEGRADFSTAPSDTAEAVVAAMPRRRPIEVTFEEARAHPGIETQRQWSGRAIERETPRLFGLYAPVALLGRELHGCGGLPVRASAWYRKTEATFADVLAAVRRACWGLEDRDILDPAGAGGVENIPRSDLDRLLTTLYYAH